MAKIEAKLLQAIWKALNEPIPTPNARAVERILLEIGDEGWMHSYQLDDLSHDSDRRTLGYHSGFDLRNLSEAMGYRWVATFRRPRMQSISAVGGDTMAAADAAAFLLDLETLGFAIDPWPLIKCLRPAILNQKLVTGPELNIFWAPKMRGRQKVTLVAEKEWRRVIPKKGKFSSGHRYEVWLGPDELVYKLEVKGPKYREIREPVETVCTACGYTWYRGDPDSSSAHRREHKQRLYVLDPQPVENMVAAYLTESEPELVTSASAAWKHNEMYQRARAFKREKRYDFVQWGSPNGDNDARVHGFLISDVKGRILGAIAFRWREPDGEPPFWGLQWVWIAPNMRRSGVLASRWAAYRDRFGDFWVEGPVSDAMQAFLAKQGDTHLIEWPSRRK